MPFGPIGARSTKSISIASRPATYGDRALYFGERVTLIGSAMALGMVALAGWIFHQPLWRSLFASSSEMKANTALCLIGLGLAMSLEEMPSTVRSAARAVSRFLAGGVAIISLLTLVEYGWDLNFGIDEGLFHDVSHPLGTAFPNRMSPPTAWSFLAGSLGLFLLDYETRKGARPQQWCALAMAFLPVYVLLVYLYGNMSVVAFGSHRTYMAVPTALGLIGLAGAQLLRAPHRGLMETLTATSEASRIFRLLLVASLLVPPTLGWIVLNLLDGTRSPPEFNVSTTVILCAAVLAGVAWINARRLNQSEEATVEQARLLDLSLDAILVRNEENRITYWNTGAEKLYGFTRKEALGQVSHHLLQTQFPAVLEEIEAQLKADGRWSGELIHTCKDGSKLVVASRWLLDLSRQGKPATLLETNTDITERRRIEEALRQSEKQFRRAIEEFPVPVIIHQEDGRVLEMSKGWTRDSGYVREDLPTISDWTRLAYGEKQPALNHYIRTLFELQETDHSGEFEIRAKDGSVRTWDFYSTPLGKLEPNGQRLLLSQAVDVTARKNAENAMRESEQRFRDLADNSPMFIWMADLEVNVLYANTTFLAYFGYRDRRDFVGKDWEKIVHPDDIGRIYRMYQNAVEHQIPYTFEIRYLEAATSTYRWHLVKGVPRFVGGKMTGFIGTGINIHNRIVAEDALRESETLIRTVTNEARVGLVLVNQARRYLFANTTYAEILGLPNANIVGKMVGEVLAPVYEQISPRLDQAFAGKRVTYELRVPPSPRLSEERIYEVVYQPRITAAETVVVVVIVDITQRKKASDLLEKTVAERTARLQEMLGELEAFSYSVSHDMRAPLRAMQGYADALLSDYRERLDDKGQQYLERIYRASHRMDSLIQDVLAYSRVAKAEIKLAPVDLGKLIDEVLPSHPEFQFPQAEIKIERPLLPVLGHEAYLTQCVTNLLGNAVKFVGPGVKPAISIRTEPWGEGVRIWFEDNGIGIEPQHQERIFQIFGQVHGENKYGGTGIGLAIVRKAVQRMDGEVGLVSELGRGSRFWIILKTASAAV